MKLPQNDLAGAFAPALTPFSGNQLEVDPGWLAQHVQQLGEAGIQGLVVLGTNGEFHSLTLQEKIEVMRHCAEHRGSLRLIAGTGTSSLKEAIEIAREAERLAYDALLVLPPWFPRPHGVAGVGAFFTGLFAATELPLLYYHIPQHTGVEFTTELHEAITQNGRLAGLKDSTGKKESLNTIRQDHPDLPLFIGNDFLLKKALEAGARGSITAATNVFPELVLRVHQERSPEAQELLNRARNLVQAGNPPAISKYILSLRGLPAAEVRPPLLPPNADLKERIRQELGALEATS